jgi:hypothetical protein
MLFDGYTARWGKFGDEVVDKRRDGFGFGFILIAGRRTERR